jgi:hypothetical protein
MGSTRNDAHECSYDFSSRFSAKNGGRATLVPLMDFLHGHWQTFQTATLNREKTSFFVDLAGVLRPNPKIENLFQGQKEPGLEHHSRASVFELWAMSQESFIRLSQSNERTDLAGKTESR